MHRCHAVVYYNTGIKKRSCFLKDDTHGPRVSAIWATSAFKPCISKEGPCPANQYKKSPLECVNCGGHRVSRPGSTSFEDCHLVYTDACWEMRNTIRPSTTYSDEMSRSDAKMMCFYSAKCRGIFCTREKGKADKCLLTDAVNGFVNDFQLNTITYLKVC